MSIDEMRSYICSVYQGSAWERKVSKMPKEQIFAIYRRLVESKKQKPKERVVQLSLF